MQWHQFDNYKSSYDVAQKGLFPPIWSLSELQICLLAQELDKNRTTGIWSDRWSRVTANTETALYNNRHMQSLNNNSHKHYTIERQCTGGTALFQTICIKNVANWAQITHLGHFCFFFHITAVLDFIKTLSRLSYARCSVSVPNDRQTFFFLFFDVIFWRVQFVT